MIVESMIEHTQYKLFFSAFRMNSKNDVKKTQVEKKKNQKEKMIGEKINSEA
jgi:hypothetical protein